MVGQHDVGIAALLGGSGHLGDLVAPVAPIAVRVQVAAQVLLLHQVGQRAFGRQLDLAASLAQLGWDPGAAQRGVDVLFCGTGDVFAHPFGAGAQLEVVGWRTGEGHPGHTETVRLHRPQVDLHAGAHPDGGRGAVLSDHFVDLR